MREWWRPIPVAEGLSTPVPIGRRRKFMPPLSDRRPQPATKRHRRNGPNGRPGVTEALNEAGIDALTARLQRAMDEAGNPSSVHAEGRKAKAIVERARAQVAALADVR